MNFGQAVKSVFSKYATFSGRASRSEYWWYFLFIILASAILLVVDETFFPDQVFGHSKTGPLSAIFTIAVLLPSLAVAVRRLHDLDSSGWWLLLNLIPILGHLFIIFWFIKRGTEGSNRFGPDPLSLTGKIVDAVKL